MADLIVTGRTNIQDRGQMHRLVAENDVQAVLALRPGDSEHNNIMAYNGQDQDSATHDFHQGSGPVNQIVIGYDPGIREMYMEVVGGPTVRTTVNGEFNVLAASIYGTLPGTYADGDPGVRNVSFFTGFRINNGSIPRTEPGRGTTDSVFGASAIHVVGDGDGDMSFRSNPGIYYYDTGTSLNPNGFTAAIWAINVGDFPDPSRTIPGPDDVFNTSPGPVVPEPSTFMLGVLGLFAFRFFQRSRK